MKDKLLKIVDKLVGSTMSAFFTFGAIFIVTAILTNFFDWAYTALLIESIAVGLFLLKSIIYAWIINPIRDWKNKGKE